MLVAVFKASECAEAQLHPAMARLAQKFGFAVGASSSSSFSHAQPIAIPRPDLALEDRMPAVPAPIDSDSENFRVLLESSK